MIFKLPRRGHLYPPANTEIKDDAEKTPAGRRTSITSEIFASLAKQLGRRLGFEAADVDESRKDAALAYLISGCLEGVVNVWIDEMQKEDNSKAVILGAERIIRRTGAPLQTFMKKTLKFRTTTNYIDVDLFVAPDPSTVPAYELSDLYKMVRRIRRPFGQFAQRTISFLEYILSDYQNAEV